MAGTAAKILITERQQKLLEEFSKLRTLGTCLVQRATIILLGFAGMLNEDIAHHVSLNRTQVGIWRQRWRDAWDSLCVWECTEPHRLREAILDVLADAPRPGAPATFTADQVSQIVALACEPPQLSGRPLDHWTLRELRDEAIQRRIVTNISVSQVGRFLQQAAVQPHRKKMWLNTTEKDPHKFQAEVETVCRTYLEAPQKAATDGTHTVSVDEATSLQALERNAPDKPAQPDRVPKQEFEYTRHGTTTLTAGLDLESCGTSLGTDSLRCRHPLGAGHALPPADNPAAGAPPETHCTETASPGVRHNHSTAGDGAKSADHHLEGRRSALPGSASLLRGSFQL